MNRFQAIILCWIIIIHVTPAFAGYRDMKSKIETYEPPAYVQSKTIPAPPGTESPPPAADTELEKAAADIRRMKENWMRDLDAVEDGHRFFRPDRDLIRKFEKRANQVEWVAGQLKNGFTLEELAVLALLRNPGIRAARRSAQAEIESFTQVTNLDEVLRQYTAFTAALMNGVGPMKGKDAIRMKYPFPGIMALKGQVVNQSVTAAREAVEIARREAVTGIRKSYWNLVFIHESRKITADTLSLYRDLESVANSLYRSGKTSFQDVIKITIRTKILEEDLVTIQERQRNIETDLLKILNLPYDTVLGEPASQPPDTSSPGLGHLQTLAFENRQELNKKRAMIGKVERMIEMAETMILPNYTLNLSFFENEAVNQVGTSAMKPAFETVTTAGMGKGLPKNAWFGTRDAWLGQTRQTLLSLREDLEKTEADTARGVREAWFDMDRAVRETRLYRDAVLELSKSALDVSTRGYESGSVSFADVIETYSNWLKVRLSLAKKKSDIGIARAKIEQAVGTSFR